MSMNPWILAARPKTLSAAIAPVAVGTALAVFNETFVALPALAALAGALLIQIGTNFANDVLDFKKGADTDERLGPTRATQAGLLSERQMTVGTVVVFALAVLVGLYLVGVGGTPILVIGIVSILSGILYTAGPYPLAYVGLGDLFVMVFFGIVAVTGTYFVQSGEWTLQALLLGISVGALSVGILIVNNLRDIETDAAVGKKTLAVRMGDRQTRRYFAAMMGLGFLIPVVMSVLRGLKSYPEWGLGPAAVLVIFALPLAQRAILQVRMGTAGAALNPVLGLTAKTQIWHALFLTLGLLVDRALSAYFL